MFHKRSFDLPEKLAAKTCKFARREVVVRDDFRVVVEGGAGIEEGLLIDNSDLEAFEVESDCEVEAHDLEDWEYYGKTNSATRNLTFS